MTIPDDKRQLLYKYIAGIVTHSKSQLIAIDGIANHVHIFLNLHSMVSLGELVKTIKQSTSKWMKSCGDFPLFEGWGHEFFSSTVSFSVLPNVKSYINHQQEHHNGVSYEDELRSFVEAIGEEWNEHILT